MCIRDRFGKGETYTAPTTRRASLSRNDPICPITEPSGEPYVDRLRLLFLVHLHVGHVDNPDVGPILGYQPGGHLVLVRLVQAHEAHGASASLCDHMLPKTSRMAAAPVSSNFRSMYSSCDIDALA